MICRHSYSVSIGISARWKLLPPGSLHSLCPRPEAATWKLIEDTVSRQSSLSKTRYSFVSKHEVPTDELAKKLVCHASSHFSYFLKRNAGPAPCVQQTISGNYFSFDPTIVQTSHNDLDKNISRWRTAGKRYGEQILLYHHWPLNETWICFCCARRSTVTRSTRWHVQFFLMIFHWPGCLEYIVCIADSKMFQHIGSRCINCARNSFHRHHLEWWTSLTGLEHKFLWHCRRQEFSSSTVNLVKRFKRL